MFNMCELFLRMYIDYLGIAAITLKNKYEEMIFSTKAS